MVSDNGTLPVDDLYFDLKPGSINLGEVDQSALLAGATQNQINNPEGGYQLFRVGDVVTSRNIHSAIYDALRLCVAF